MAYTFQNARIMIVDDVRPMQLLIKQMLEVFGFTEIMTCSNGEEALAQYKQFNPDLILLDWVMEPMNGLELAAKIRMDTTSPNPFVPIIMMTGYSARKYIEKARDSGITEIVLKPFSANDLYKRIEYVIEKPRQFVKSEDFFGPDRRRRRDHYKGPVRRKGDKMPELTMSDQKEHSNLLGGMAQELKQTKITEAKSS